MSSSSSILRIEVPRKLRPLLRPARYKGAYGGRGGAKSHFFAEQVIVRCLMSRTRVVCIREVQKSIRDSVRQLLIDKIGKLGLDDEFHILETEIRGPHGSLIIFVGMQSYNATNIKSLEGYDIAWVEEAQTLSSHSLEILRPTLRAEGSELWFSWNPRNKRDPVDQLFRKNPPPDAISVEVNWRDNPWFPNVLRAEMEHDFATDPDSAEHIWNGAYGSGRGAILARWVNKARREGRIGDFDYDPDGAPIDLSSDLGFRDTTVWWFWQRMHGGFTLFKCISDHGLDADDWIPILQDAIGDRPLGKIWLPQDAKVKTFQSRHSSLERFLTAYGRDHVDVVPASKKSDQVSAARKVIDQCQFNETACEDGLDGLSAWEYEWNEDDEIFSREPHHGWPSHYGDSFAYGCQVLREVPVPVEPEEPRHLEVGAGNTMQLNDWKPRQQPRRV